METYVVLALVGMVFFGINGILYKIAPGIDAVSLTLVSFAVSAIVSLIYWFFFVPEKQMALSGIGVGVIAGVTSVIALVVVIKALQLGNASIVMPIRALSAAITVILAIIFLSEKLTLVKAIGVVLAITAGILLSL